ncbi:isopeptide-forming domain-containing fimbrial protein [Halalkalibacterium halodurans]|nr:isopeptide-forming domain-containing fimbrial protein [Halalkalibacterium halodurans]
MYPAPLYAEGNQSEDEWVLSKEVEGQTSKKVGKEEEFSYDINLKVPDDLEEFENLTVIDEIDSRLTIQQVIVVVDDEVDSSIPSDLDGQKVSVKFSGDQLKHLVGKTVTVQVTVQLNDDVEAGEQIENIAEVIGDGTSLVESNNVTVTVVGDEEQPVEEEEAESESKLELEQQEEASEEEETVVGINNVEANNVLEINDVDSYGISINILDGSLSQIRQFDGNNFNADPKAIVMVTGIPGNVLVNNGLAVHPTENAFYAYGASPEIPHGLYRITPDGVAELVGILDGVAANGVISQDGNIFPVCIMPQSLV